jgi:hypothetical protein
LEVRSVPAVIHPCCRGWELRLIDISGASNNDRRLISEGAYRFFDDYCPLVGTRESSQAIYCLGIGEMPRSGKAK